MSNTAKELLDILDQVGESASFCVHGSLDPVLAGLDVTGVGSVAFPIGAAEAKELIAVASQAPYGRGEETLVDTEVRRVWQLEPKQFKLSLSPYLPAQDGGRRAAVIYENAYIGHIQWLDMHE